MINAENARDLERENTELRRQLDEALAREKATAEVLLAINSSLGDLAPVFDAILDKALHLCEANFGNMFLYDGGKDRSVAVRGAPEFARWMEERGSVQPAPGSLGHRLMRGEDVVHIMDAAKEAAYESSVTRRAVVEIGGFHTLLAVALRKADVPLGGIVVYRKEVRSFTDKQIALLQNFAAQAVIAMENARLISETREALEQQTATAEVLGVINSSPGELSPVFDAMLERAMTLCESSFGGFFIHEGERVRAAATRGVPSRLDDFIRQGFTLNPSIWAFRGEAIEHVIDLAQEDLAERPGNAAARDLGGARTILNVALRKDDLLLGILSVYRTEVRPFTDKQIALLQNFAAQAVIAMENARLITETREALEQQTATAEVLGVINSSPGDLAPVFDAILEKAHNLCGVAFGSLQLYDDGKVRAVAVRAIAEDLAELLRQPMEPRPGSALSRLLAGEHFVQNVDILALAQRFPDDPRIQLSAARGLRTGLFVPLRKEDDFLGYISAFRDQVRPFSEKEIALLQNFAAQAVIAMENARLITETREALEQQTATAEVLQVINSSPGDLVPVFDAMLEKAARLCDTAFGVFHSFDGEAFHTIALRGAPAALVDFYRQPLRPFPGSYADRFVQGETIVSVDDLSQVESYQTGRATRAVVDLGGGRSLVGIALRNDDKLLGAFWMYRQEVRPFTEKQIALLQNFAAQAVIAMENARLITETREALEQQTATAEVLGVINSSPGDLAPVFDAILEKAMHLCGAAFGELRARDGDSFRSAATRGVPVAFAEYRRDNAFVAEPGSLGARILAGEQFVHVLDLKDEDVYRAGYRNRRALVDLGGARTALVASLRKDDTVLGFIIVYRQEVRPFTNKQIALLQSFADQAVIAMENARLLGELRQRTEEVAELNRGLEARVAEQVEELGRVGRLKRFLAPQLAELIVSQGDEKILESHRREIVVVFCDLRGYTAFTETAEPEEVLDFLREYHGALGPLVAQFEGTLDQFSGDGIMVFFNDPVPIPDPAERAVKMAVSMREAAGALIGSWRRRGRELGFGAGIAQGYATLGQIGFAERSGYTAIGTVCNLAARLCAEAKDGQILIAQRVAVAVDQAITLEEIGSLSLKGLTQPVVAYNVPVVGNQAVFRVIEGGAPSA